MRLLITRPEPDASDTAARLASRGHQVLVQSLLTISFSPPAADLPVPAAVLVTSQNGARALSRWSQTRAWLRTPVFATGLATARALREIGFTDVRVGGGDVAALAERVVDDLPPSAGPLIYPAARDRAGALSARLTALGYDVRTIEAYRAEPTTHLAPTIRTAILGGSVDGILLYSRRTATALADLASAEGIAEALAGVTYYVISEQVGERIRGIVGPTGAIKVAARPDEDSVLALIPS